MSEKQETAPEDDSESMSENEEPSGQPLNVAKAKSRLRGKQLKLTNIQSAHLSGDGKYYGAYDPDEPDFLSSHAEFYPPTALLEELGRVVVASSRLEFIAHRLWVFLQASDGSAPTDLAKTRRIPGSELIKNIRARVGEVVHSDWREDVLADLDRAADADDEASIVMALRYRNADIHSAWMLRDPPELADPEDGRSSVDGDWWLIANDEDHAEPAPSVVRLRKTEEACREGARRLLTLADDLSYKRMAKGSQFVTVGADTLVQMYEPDEGWEIGHKEPT